MRKRFFVYAVMFILLEFVGDIPFVIGGEAVNFYYSMIEFVLFVILSSKVASWVVEDGKKTE